MPEIYVANRYPETFHGIGMCDEYPTVAPPQDWDAVKSARSNAEAALARTMDTVYAPALTEFTAEQLFIIVDRHAQYQKAFALANRLRTTPDSDWPRVREWLAIRVTDREYFAVWGAAIAAWEQRTGMRSDIVGGPTYAELGVEQELDAIRQAGREYIESLRQRGASDADLASIAYLILGQAIEQRGALLQFNPSGFPDQK